MSPLTGPVEWPAGNDIHVWRVNLEHSGWDAWECVLAEEEAQRYRRVIAEPARRDWRRSRIALRLLLSRYLHTPAAALVFGSVGRGKPQVIAQTPLPFNLSHSNGVALIALSASDVGIDIERIDDRGAADLGRLLAGIRTSGDVCDDASDNVARAFYRLWTRKEAYCKACGQGLHMSMQHFAVRPGHALQTHEVRPLMPVDGPPWYVHDLPCEPGWMACICTMLPSPRVFNTMFIVPETGRPELRRAEKSL